MPTHAKKYSSPSRHHIRVQIHLHLAPKVLPARRQPLERHPERNRDKAIQDRLVVVVQLDVKRVDTRPAAGLPVEEVLFAQDPRVGG